MEMPHHLKVLHTSSQRLPDMNVLGRFLFPTFYYTRLSSPKVSSPRPAVGAAPKKSPAVLFLVETDFITGDCIRVDGGRHLY
jgi:hypothetical protein